MKRKLVGMLLGGSAALSAANAPADRVPVNAEALASSCSGCHSVADSSIPNLDSLTSDQIENYMLAFRSEERDGTVMQRIAKGYSAAEIKSLAQAIAQKNPMQK